MVCQTGGGEVKGKYCLGLAVLCLAILFWSGAGFWRELFFPEQVALWRSIEVERVSGEIGQEVEEWLGNCPCENAERERLFGALWEVRDLIDEGRIILDDERYPRKYRAREANIRFREAAKISIWVSERLRWVMQNHLDEAVKQKGYVI